MPYVVTNIAAVYQSNEKDHGPGAADMLEAYLNAAEKNGYQLVNVVGEHDFVEAGGTVRASVAPLLVLHRHPAQT
ncbi:hypothetical protein GCM10009641_88410 [Mycobacterium cookii]|uniref:Uncharacterized protein n=1 Tax=Nocardioides furvisabuli TaxID=375542 RepID=A0ABN2WLQ2_9ACTN|nr:hypothetical protein [Nocardioides furvisabuli]